MTSLNGYAVAATSAGLTTATTAYTAGDQVGTIFSWNVTSTPWMLAHCTLLDKAGVLGASSLHLFSQSVTLASDNAAFSLSDADAAFWLGAVLLGTPMTYANGKFIDLDSIAKLLTAASATTVYGALVTETGHTFFGATTDVVITLRGLKDV